MCSIDAGDRSSYRRVEIRKRLSPVGEQVQALKKYKLSRVQCGNFSHPADHGLIVTAAENLLWEWLEHAEKKLPDATPNLDGAEIRACPTARRVGPASDYSPASGQVDAQDRRSMRADPDQKLDAVSEAVFEK